jgi:hypothetical protein
VIVPLIAIELGALLERRGQEADAGGQPGSPVVRAAAREALARLELLAPPVILAGTTAAGRDLPSDATARVRFVRTLLGDPARRVVCWEPASERPDGAHETVWAPRPADPDALARALRPRGEPGFLIVDGDADVVGWRALGLQIIRLGPPPDSPLAALHRPDHDARDLRDAANWILLRDAFEGQAEP